MQSVALVHKLLARGRKSTERTLVILTGETSGPCVLREGFIRYTRPSTNVGRQEAHLPFHAMYPSSLLILEKYKC